VQIAYAPIDVTMRSLGERGRFLVIVSDERKAIHDHIAGTVVLHRTS
jgi:uncharacterized RDD family membrane protein YckC